jgi:hypothetical protein
LWCLGGNLLPPSPRREQQLLIIQEATAELRAVLHHVILPMTALLNFWKQFLMSCLLWLKWKDERNLVESIDNHNVTIFGMPAFETVNIEMGEWPDWMSPLQLYWFDIHVRTMDSDGTLSNTTERIPRDQVSMDGSYMYIRLEADKSNRAISGTVPLGQMMVISMPLKFKSNPKFILTEDTFYIQVVVVMIPACMVLA